MADEISFFSRLHEVGLFTAIQSEGSYQTGQVGARPSKNAEQSADASCTES